MHCNQNEIGGTNEREEEGNPPDGVGPAGVSVLIVVVAAREGG